MKQLIIILSIIFVITHKSINAQDDNGLYSRRYERLDIGTILASPRLVTNYVDCLLNKKPCPPEGKALKRILPEALRTKCGKCWPSQKEGALKVITALYNDYPKHYNALREKWDPTGEYHRRFEEYVRDQTFNSIGSNNQDNNDINQGEQTQVTATIVANTNKKASSNINSNSIASDQSSHKSNRKPSVQNRATYSHRTQTVVQSLRSNSNKVPPVQSRTPQNSKGTTQVKSSRQHSKNISVIENHRTNSNRTTHRISNRIQLIETTSPNRIVSVQNLQPKSNRIQIMPTSKPNSNRIPSIQTQISNRIAPLQNPSPNLNRISSVQTTTINSNRIPPSLQNQQSNLNRISSPIQTPPQNFNRLPPSSSNSNNLLSVQTPLFNFNILPSVGTPAPNFNRIPLTTSTPSRSYLPSTQDSPFNFNIIPSIQTSLNLNRVPLLISPPSNTNNRIPFIQSPPYFTPQYPAPESYIPPKPTPNNNLNYINIPSGKQTSSNQISYRFLNNERPPSQNSYTFSQRPAPNIPKPEKIITNNITPTITTRIPQTRVSTTKFPSSRRNPLPTTQIPTIRHVNNNEVTQRPTRQGIKPTTIVQPIINRPSNTIPTTTLTSNRQTTKRLTTRPSITTRRTTTRVELPELNPPNELANRFGSEEENVAISTSAAITTTRRPSRPLQNQPQPAPVSSITRRPSRPLQNQPQEAPVSSNQPQYVPGFVTTTTFQSSNNILNIINRLTTKLSNTADFVAGVLRVPQAIVQNTRNHHRVIWQNLAKNIRAPIQKHTTLTFRLF